MWGSVLSFHSIDSGKSTRWRLGPTELLPLPSSHSDQSHFLPGLHPTSCLPALVLLLLWVPLHLTRAAVLGMSVKLCTERETSPVGYITDDDAVFTSSSSLLHLVPLVWNGALCVPSPSMTRGLPVQSAADPLQVAVDP